MIPNTDMKSTESQNNDRIIQTENHSEPHPIFATVIDLYIVEVIIGILVSLWSFLSRKAMGSTFYLIIGITMVTITIVYHSYLCIDIKWLSPGEIIAGKFFINGNKIWFNPYGINRGLLFALVIITILLTRNSSIQYVYELSIYEILGLLIKHIVVYSGLLLIGKGKLKGVLLIVLYLVMSFLLAQFFTNDIIRFSGIISLTFAFVFSIIAFYYRTNRI